MGKDGTWGKSIKNNKDKNNKNVNKIKINLLGDRKFQENDEITIIKFDSKSYNITVFENVNTISEDEDVSKKILSLIIQIELNSNI